MKNNRRLKIRVRVRFLYFILKSPSLARDVTISRFYLGGKNMEISDEQPQPIKEY